MTYEKACEVLGLTTPKSFEENARLAESRLRNTPATAPLRITVACKVLMDAPNEY